MKKEIKTNRNDTVIPITNNGKTATQKNSVKTEIYADERYLYFKDRAFIETGAGENLVKIDAQLGQLHFSRNLISFGGNKLPLNLALVFNFQHPEDTTINDRETGFPIGMITNYHQTCIKQGNKYYYMDGEAYLHIFEQAGNTQSIWVDRQGTGLLLKTDGAQIEIYDEFGNFSKFDEYGRLYLIHQKITSSNSADLKIYYEGATEKIASIMDGMGRTVNFTYTTNSIKISINSNAYIEINMYNYMLTSVVRWNNGTGEEDTYYLDYNNWSITAVNGENIQLEIYYEQVIKYGTNINNRWYDLNYSYTNTKVIGNGGTQVYTFNEKNILTGKYQDLNGKTVNVYCVDKETCSAFSSILATDGLRQFTFGTSGEIEISGNGNVNSDWIGSYEIPNTKFSIFSAKMEAKGNYNNYNGKITVDLIDLLSGNNLCTLEFNPTLTGLQIAAKPFTGLDPQATGASFYARVNVSSTSGSFTFKELYITPSTGNVEKFCSNQDIYDGGFGEDYDRVYFLNGGTGVSVNGGGDKDNSIVLYEEDYLANARNVYKPGIDGETIFWYNNKRGCIVGLQSATVNFGNGATITFNYTGSNPGIYNKVGNEVNFYSLSSAPNGITTLTKPNYDSSKFPAAYKSEYLQTVTTITDGQTFVENYAYYDENLNLRIEQTPEQQTEYDINSSGNVTAVKTKTTSGTSLNLLSNYGYDSKDYLTSATDYVGTTTATSKYTYDTFGNTTKNVAPNTFTQEYGYDTFGDRMTKLSAEIKTDNQTTQNNISYSNALINQMSESGGAVYNFEYHTNSNLKSVKIGSTAYVNVAYNYAFNQDKITKSYGNGYTQEDTYDKYGNLIIKGFVADYIYADNKTAAYLAFSPTDSRLIISSGSKLYKINYGDIAAQLYFDYNAYNMLTYIKYEYYDDYYVTNIAECNLEYDNNLRLDSEIIKSNGGQVQKITYGYRTNLNYYSEVQNSYTYNDGATLQVQKSWDNLNRLTSVKTLNDSTKRGMQIDISYLARSSNSADTTNYIKDWKYSTVTNNNASSAIRTDSFEYDVNGNVTKYKINIGATSTVDYVYDEANRLLRENNPLLGRTYVYKYDSRGNILGKSEYNYTTASNLTATQNYTYNTYDRLTNWNNKTFEYDNCGNPTRYKGETMSWERGRLLASYKNVDFVYDGSGERFSKTTFNGTTRYITLNGKLVWEESSENTITYLYGATGLIGCIIDGTQYYYAKNMFGDVVALIRTSDNTIVAQYMYDAWGNHKVYDSNGNENTDPYFVGNLNPIRYRSYYWDSDVQLYYLHTRWYDPEIGRFVNLDQIEYLDPQTVNGLNLYAYCLNNPVMGVDPDGTVVLTALLIIAGILISGIITGLTNASEIGENESYWGAFVGGFIDGAIGAIAIAAGLATGSIGGLIITAVISFGGGFAGNAVSQYISYGDINSNLAFLQGGISAFYNSVAYIGLSLAGITSGAKWLDRFVDALKISEIGVGISVFLSYYSFPNVNKLREKE